MSIKVNKNMIKSHKKSKPDINFNDMRKRRNKVQILGRYDYLEKEKFEFPRLNEMLYQSRKTQIFCKNNIINRIIIIIILFGLQLYSIIMPFAEGSISIFEFIIFLTVKMIFCEKILAFNLIDIVLNRKKVMKLMKKKNVRVIFWITLTCYIFLFISFIIIFCITRRSIYATVDRSRYYENEGTWYKYDENFTMNPEPFCYGKSLNDGTLQTADFAMMTTLPRLYGINEEGRCYIKPSKRGLFNSTMKYIFGREYEKDNIRIFCKKIFHDPILIITSDKILESTMKHFSATNITKIEAQFNITNKNYFNEQRIESIKNEVVRALYDK
ncbi:hypothetical protein M9Y10_036807 [Tritrichomonas musculus]|uniref:Uncharacterized protein n=1 Tax=Tritrichomonas musculus TaxID=1915356 RepID=A0ABR2GTU1_9EUKA